MEPRRFNIEEALLRNHNQPINAWQIPNQLRPVAAELARKGYPPYALATLAQQLLHEQHEAQRTTVVVAPVSHAFNSQAAILNRQY